MKMRSLAPAGLGRARRCWATSSSVRCWRTFSMSPRTCVTSERSTVDSAPGEMIRLASRNAHTSASARLTRASASLSCASMNLRASGTRAVRSRWVDRGEGDLEDARRGDAGDLDLRRDRVERRPVALRLAERLARHGLRQPPEPLRPVLEDRVALDEAHLPLHLVGARVRQDLDEEPGELRGLLVLDRGRRLEGR